MLENLNLSPVPRVQTYMMMSSPYHALIHWNALDAQSAASEVLPCCGSRAWANCLTALRPFEDEQQLYEASDRVWDGLTDDDWREAFDSHPRIGQQRARSATSESLVWSSQEQRAAMSSTGSQGDAVKLALAEGNRQYEERFGRIFIVCAAGKSAAEILAILNARMNSTPSLEWREAAEQQRQITQLRLRQWLGANK
jgi:2-oxo-4-hydroxy-4-carboxy-5-ureidoimidazoline decarboxylase